MTEDLPVENTLILYACSLFVAGIIFFVQDFIRRPRMPDGAPKSRSGWIDFGLMLWGVIMVLYGTQLMWKHFVGNIDLGLWSEVGLGLSVQLITILFVIVSIYAFPKIFSSPINKHETALLPSIVKGGFYFLSALPVIWATSFAWNIILEILKRFDIEFTIDHQQLVKLFAQSDSMAFTLTVLLFAIIIAPVTEEFIFRAGVYRFLKLKMGRSFGAIISAVAFASAHANIMAFLPLVAMGILLARSYEKSGSIATNITFHGLFNLNTLIILMLQPNLPTLTQ